MTSLCGLLALYCLSASQTPKKTRMARKMDPFLTMSSVRISPRAWLGKVFVPKRVKLLSLSHFRSVL
jgi:hypothetical protein